MAELAHDTRPPEVRVDGDIAPDPLIIFGAPRSGTTYLQQVVNKHPDIFISRETRIFFWAHEMAEKLPRDEQERFVHTHKNEFGAAIVPWTRHFIRDLYRDLGDGAYFWGDKYPNYAGSQELLRFILRLYDQARFIHIVRDGRDVAASLLQMDWAKQFGFEGAHKIWINSVEGAARLGRELPSWQYCELRYEDLVRDGHAAIQTLFDFIGVPADGAVNAYLTAQARKRTPHSSPSRDAELLNAGESQWAKLLTPEEQRRSIELLEPHLTNWGYAPDVPPGAAP